MAEFVIVTWTMIQDRMEQHEESIKRTMDYWYKSAKRLQAEIDEIVCTNDRGRLVPLWKDVGVLI